MIVVGEFENRKGKANCNGCPFCISDYRCYLDNNVHHNINKCANLFVAEQPVNKYEFFTDEWDGQTVQYNSGTKNCRVQITSIAPIIYP